MLRNVPKLCLNFARWNPIHVDLEPNPMPYTARLWRKRHPHRMKNAFEVTHDQIPDDLGLWPSLDRRLAVAPKQRFKTVGEIPVKPDASEFSRRFVLYRKNKRSFAKSKLQRENKIEIDPQMVNAEWSRSFEGLRAARAIAHHYGIFKDLLGSFDFYPVAWLRLIFEGSAFTLGDFCSPEKMKERPALDFPFDSSKLYTALVVNLDGNPLSESSSSLQWLMVNNRGGAFTGDGKGNEIIQYLQPYPLRGLGYHRVVCALFEQADEIKVDPRRSNVLEDRSFDTVSFFSQRREMLNPVGLAMVQCKWDQSVTDIFHEHFNVPEPIYQYDFREELPPAQLDIPEGQPFNEYLDAYRDRKEMNAQALLAYLKKTCPFRGPLDEVPFPHAEPFPSETPTWKKEEVKDMWSRLNQWANMPRRPRTRTNEEDAN